MRSHRYFWADVFTDRALAGNQLAVFTHAEEMADDLLQPIAREMNLAETVFVYPSERGNSARVRYFTTVEELEFAGHPTLGTAAIIAAERFSKAESVEIVLETRRADVPVQVEHEAPGYLGWMSAPIPTVQSFDKGDELLSVLNVKQSRLPIEVYDGGIQHLFVTLDDVDDVLAIEPDFKALGALCGPSIRINVFARAGEGNNYTTRMFSPFDQGAPEDPATGSAAGSLVAHLLRHGEVDSGHEITLSQGEKVGRPSTLYAAAEGTREKLDAIQVGGTTIILGQGEFRL